MLNFEMLVRNEWTLFINHVSKYYKIPEVIIGQYQEEFKWYFLSQNENLDWSRSLIDQFKSRWRWSFLGANQSIKWRPIDLKNYKGFLNVIDLRNHENFKVDAQFLSGRLKKNFQLTSQNKYFTKELQKQFPERVYNWSRSIPKYPQYSEVYQKMLYQNSEHSADQRFYTNEIEPYLDDDKLQQILEDKFSVNQKYYFMSLGIDMILNYQVVGKGDSYELDDDFFSSLDDDEVLKINGNHVTGKRIVPEYSEINTVSSIYLMSSFLKQVLDVFELPKHKFCATDIKHDRLTSDATFYVLKLFSSESVYNSLDYSKVKILAKTSNRGEDLKYVSIEDQINSKTELYTYRTAQRNIERIVLNHKLVSNYDLYSYRTKVVVNEFVKSALEQVFPNHFRFRSANYLQLEIAQEMYEEKRKRYNAIDWSTKHIGKVNYEIDKEYVFLNKKRLRLKKQMPVIAESEFSSKEIGGIERKLNIIISKETLNAIKSLEGDEEYQLLDENKYYLENEYASDLPETFNSLIVAENGMGDALGFILLRESDYSHGSLVYEFSHEEGDVVLYEPDSIED